MTDAARAVKSAQTMSHNHLLNKAFFFFLSGSAQRRTADESRLPVRDGILISVSHFQFITV